MDPISITCDLIGLPSFEQEIAVAEYIYAYLKRFSFLSVTKQVVKAGRFNVIARSPGKPQLLLAGHMDTVTPKAGSNRNPLTATFEGERLYGLGAYDMKGGIAAILGSLNQLTDIRGLTLLFYCDEEYDFLGMKKFIAQEKSESKPKLALIAEPTDLKIWNAHRGLIELSFAVAGASGHAANPAAGVNAITGLQSVLSKLDTWLQTFNDPDLGRPSLNVAYLRGGLNKGQESDQVALGRDGNNIADYAEAVIDIRPTSSKLRAAEVVGQLKILVTAAGLTLVQIKVSHDYGALYTDPRSLETIENIVGETYLDAQTKGYGDGQLIQTAWNIPVAYFGPTGGNAHAANEWVDPKSIQTTSEAYARIIKSHCCK